VGKIRDRLEEILAGSFFCIGSFLVVYGVIMRYVFHAPLFWVDEISTYLLLWGILLGWSLAQQDGRHVCVDLLYAFLPKKWQYRIGVFEKICSILFCIFLFVASVTLWLHYVNNAQVSTNAQIKLWIVYLIMPLSSLMFLIRFIEEIISLIRGGIDSLKSIDIGGGH
jgi:C4-dicarboxylate transporter DctQ subunit